MTFNMQKAQDMAAHPIHCEETDEMFRAALAEIGRLQQDNNSLMDALLGGGAKIIINNAEQAKRIAEPEKALVEERARGNHYGIRYEDAIGGEIDRWIVGGEIDASKIYIEKMRDEARQQLRQEGKL